MNTDYSFITGEYSNIDSLKDSRLVIHYNFKTLVRGYKHYELSTHLGNVLVVISDKRITLCTSSVVSGYEADVISASDYYPFGMLMSERSFSSPAYRYGFNGKEKTDEINGEGNDYDFGARIYESRLGRWLSLDPLQKKYPSLSPYNYCANSPIFFIDPDGKKIIPGKNWANSDYERVWKAILQTKNAEFVKIYTIFNETTTDLTLEHLGEKDEKDFKPKKYYADIGGITIPAPNGGISSTIQMNQDFGKLGTRYIDKVGDVGTLSYSLELNDVGRALFLFHEMLHAESIANKKYINPLAEHTKMTVGDPYKSMIQFLNQANKDLKWNLSPEDRIAISFLGLQSTCEFEEYINKKAGLDNNWRDEKDKVKLTKFEKARSIAFNSWRKDALKKICTQKNTNFEENK